MDIELENAKKPLRKLRRTLKRLTPDPAAEDVHALRTQTRRLEAIVNALMLEHKKRTRQLLKSMTPVRKAAGGVRDMDVLVGNVLALRRDREDDDSLIRLIEHLGQMRMEGARELHQTVFAHRKDAQRSLKGYTKLVERQFPRKKQVIENAGPAPAALAAELANWPALNEKNIHEFRIRVKQLRYMIQLSGAADKKTLAALGKVKDDVGDWHDWQELDRIAKQVLNPKSDRAALKKIEEIGERKFTQAMASANAARERYFSGSRASARKSGRKAASKRGV